MSTRSTPGDENQVSAFEKKLTLFGTGIAGIIIGLDLTIVNSSLPNIQKELGASLAQMQWVIAGFGLFFCSFLVVMGRFGDLYGHKKWLIMSLIFFAIASLGAGVSYSVHMLIFMRMLQGLFGAAIIPCGVALTASAFPQSEQGRALGIYGSMVGVGIGVGPLVGGVIEHVIHWRWIFFINMPIILFSLFICIYVLKESKQKNNIAVDWCGGLFLAALLFLGVFVLSEGHYYGWLSWPILSAFCLSLLGFAVFIYNEKRAATPVMPMHLFQNTGFLLATLIYAGSVSFHWPVLFLMPIYLHDVAAFGASKASLLLSAMTLMTVISPVLSGYFYDKKNKTVIVHLIFALNIIGLLMFLAFNITGPVPLIVASFIVFGLAWGIGNGVATPIALSKLPNHEDAGVVSGAITTILNIFAVLSLTLSSALFQTAKTYYNTKFLNVLDYKHRMLGLSFDSISIFSEKIKLFYPIDVADGIIVVLKSGFLFGMKSAYVFILCATFICWCFVCRLVKKHFKPG